MDRGCSTVQRPWAQSPTAGQKARRKKSSRISSFSCGHSLLEGVLSLPDRISESFVSPASTILETMCSLHCFWKDEEKRCVTIDYLSGFLRVTAGTLFTAPVSRTTRWEHDRSWKIHSGGLANRSQPISKNLFHEINYSEVPMKNEKSMGNDKRQ